MTAQKLAVRDILTNDSTYLALLGNPSEEPYKTYYLYPPTVPDFPYVVFAFSTANVDSEVDKYILQKRIELIVYVFAQDSLYETIAERIVYLMHQTGDTNGFRIVYDRDNAEEYISKINAYMVSKIFNLFYRKEII